jgi:hypothetical protein
VYIENERAHDFCGKRCAEKYTSAGNRPASDYRSSSPVLPEQCKLAGCRLLAFVDRNGIPGQYCSQSHRRCVGYVPIFLPSLRYNWSGRLWRRAEPRLALRKLTHSRYPYVSLHTCTHPDASNCRKSRSMVRNATSVARLVETKLSAMVSLFGTVDRQLSLLGSHSAPAIFDVPVNSKTFNNGWSTASGPSTHINALKVVAQFDGKWEHQNKPKPTVIKVVLLGSLHAVCRLNVSPGLEDLLCQAAERRLRSIPAACRA